MKILIGKSPGGKRQRERRDCETGRGERKRCKSRPGQRGEARTGLGERSTSIPALCLRTSIIRWNVHRIWISINLAQSILGTTAYLHITMAYMY